MKIKKLTLLVATLTMVLGIGSSTMAQVAEEPVAENPVAEESEAEGSVAEEPVAELSCADLFRNEQIELAEGAAYPTSVSEEARACDDSGAINPYPAPYFYDTDGLLYTYDPVSDRYTSSYDEAAGVYHIYDLVSNTFYAYDPASGTYVE